MRVLNCILAVVLIGIAGDAVAAEHISGRVTTVEATYMPGTVTFRLDSGTLTCPAGTWLKWAKDAENNKAVYAALLTAISSGKKVTFYHESGSCNGVFLHVTSQ